MRQNGFAQRRVWQPGNHCNLNRGHDLSGVDGEAGEAENTIAVLLDQGLEESACFRKSARPKYFLHRDFEQPVWDAAPFRFRLIKPDAGKFGIREHAERNLPAGRDMVTATDIVAKYTEIIERDRKDSSRAMAPLRPAQDAIMILTDNMPIEQVVDTIIKLCDRRETA